MKLTFIIIAIIALLGAVGYFLNIYKLATETDFEAPYKAEVIRGAGVLIPPVGAIAGYFDVGN